MTPAKPTMLELAKQGNPKAIEALLNRNLQPKGITAKVAFKDNCLQIMLESAQVPAESVVTAFVQKGIESLAVPAIKTLKIYGRQTGDEFPAWSQEVILGTHINSKQTVQAPQLSAQTSGKTSNNNGVRATTLISKSNSLTGIFTSFRKLAIFEKALTVFEKSSKTQKVLVGFGTLLGCSCLLIVTGMIFRKHEISGELLLSDDGFEFRSDGTFCTGTGGYGDIGDGTQIVVKNDSGKTVAIGSLQSGSIANDRCLFPIKVEDIPDSGFYVIEIGNGRRGSLSYSKKEMQNMNWELGITIGD